MPLVGVVAAGVAFVLWFAAASRTMLRGHDRRADDVQGTSAAEQQLARRVLMVLMRMVTSYEDGKGAPPDAERARCLYDRWLLDVPKLLDVAALYGPANPRLVSQFLSSVFTLQPQYKGDVQAFKNHWSPAHTLQGIVPPLIANLGSVLQQATAAARAASRGDAAAFASLCDDGTYMLDVCATLGAFVSCYPAGAALLLAPGPGSLIGALTEVHDQLLPLLLRHIKSSASAPSASATSSTSSVGAVGCDTYGALLSVCGDGGLSDCVCGGLAHPSANAGNESHHQLFDDDGACPMSDRAAESLHIYELQCHTHNSAADTHALLCAATKSTLVLFLWLIFPAARSCSAGDEGWLAAICGQLQQKGISIIASWWPWPLMEQGSKRKGRDKGSLQLCDTWMDGGNAWRCDTESKAYCKSDLTTKSEPGGEILRKQSILERNTFVRGSSEFFREEKNHLLGNSFWFCQGNQGI
eukprot:1157391-Pelagomonas_calceolata.AAC.7